MPVDILERLDRLKEENHWSAYRLAREAGLADATIANIFTRRALPHIDTLEAICKAFGLTLSQFFMNSENESSTILTNSQLEFYHKWEHLTNDKKKLVFAFMDFLDTIN